MPRSLSKGDKRPVFRAQASCRFDPDSDPDLDLDDPNYYIILLQCFNGNLYQETFGAVFYPAGSYFTLRYYY
jgi:hypothetical protein